MVKRWLTPSRYDRPESHLEFFLKIQHVHGQKMIDPPIWDQDLTWGGQLSFDHGHVESLKKF